MIQDFATNRPRRIDWSPANDCHYCERIVADDPPYLLPYFECMRRGWTVTQCVVVCGDCFSAEAALIEAKENGCRFSEVNFADRCACGRATHGRLGQCVPCWRDSRFFAKREAEIRFNAKLIRKIRSEARGDQDRRVA